MRVPDFLIIGAMKAGTTTLFRDLSGHPGLFLPEEKEPETLVRFGDRDDQIRADFASLFARADAAHLCGEASTAYTKRPDNEGVAARALRICGPNLRLIHLTRNPVGRAVSHYKHDVGQKYQDKPFDEAVRRDHRYVDYSRYAWQLAPWVEAFGEDALLRLSFEDYVRDRHGTAQRVCAFLGLDPALLPPLEEDKAFNASDGKPVATNAVTRALVGSRFYQRRLKNLVPQNLRHRAYHLLLPKAPKLVVTIDDATRNFLEERLADER